MKLYISNEILGDKVVDNPKFIPRAGDYIVLNKYVKRKITDVTFEYGKEESVLINTE